MNNQDTQQSSFTVEIWGHTLQFETSPTLFSPSRADRGTLAMQKLVKPVAGDKVLDLGCGWGMVGIACAKLLGEEKVWMLDNDPVAVEISRTNAVQNEVPGIRILEGGKVASLPEKDFTLIYSNPPYHSDFSVARSFIEEGYRYLQIGGRMVMVVKRLNWYRNKLTSIFGGVRVVEEDGYFVLISEKRENNRISGEDQKKKQLPNLSALADICNATAPGMNRPNIPEKATSKHQKRLELSSRFSKKHKKRK